MTCWYSIDFSAGCCLRITLEGVTPETLGCKAGERVGGGKWETWGGDVNNEKRGMQNWADKTEETKMEIDWGQTWLLIEGMDQWCWNAEFGWGGGICSLLPEDDNTRQTPQHAYTQLDEHHLCFDMDHNCLPRDHHPKVYANIPREAFRRPRWKMRVSLFWSLLNLFE